MDQIIDNFVSMPNLLFSSFISSIMNCEYNWVKVQKTLQESKMYCLDNILYTLSLEKT